MQPPSSVASRKRQNLTLDLDSASNPSRRKQMQTLLTSPDVQMLKLTSPELEKFLIANPSVATPTPSGYIFPKPAVTDEQAKFSRDFEDVLEQVKAQHQYQTDSSQSEAATTLVGLSTAVMNHYNNQQQEQAATNLPLSLPSSSKPVAVTSRGAVSPPRATGPLKVQVKEEPDDSNTSTSSLGPLNISLSTSPIPSTASGGHLTDTSSMSPIDMENQEHQKLDRKRMRNRMAASKCRKRKLEKIALLDDRVKQLKNENADLAAVVKKMKSSVAQLKQEVIEHAESGCEIRFNESSIQTAS